MKYLTANLPPPPGYFRNVVEMNTHGAQNLQEVLDRAPSLPPQEFHACIIAAQSESDGSEDLIVMDTRETNDFVQQYIAGSLNFALGTHGGDTLSPVEGNFGIWVGTLVSPQARLLIVAPPGKEEESVRRLARVGFQNVVGVLSGGIAAWADAGLDLLHAARAEVTPDLFADSSVVVIDVRTQREFNCPGTGRVSDALLISLVDMKNVDALCDLDPRKEYLCYCRGGFRSAIAASFMRRAGLKVRDVLGGIRAINELAPNAVLKPTTN